MTSLIVPSAGAPPLVSDPPVIVTPRGIAAASGRFISRGRLAARTFYWLLWLIFARRGRVGSGVEREMEALGIGALRLVIGASMLVGLIATFQIAYQLSTYSAETMSARALGWFAARELGTIVTALLVVARSASAIAGEFASMSASGELDALRAMGLDPVKYLVAPKLAALLVSLPALTVLSDAAILFGGWIGNSLFLNYSTAFYIDQVREALQLRDVAIGLGKSVLFAVVLVIVAADAGLSVERRVGAISGAATRAVVFCMIGILAMDTVVNAIFYFIPGLI